jgi:hypothetical protein
VTKPTSLPVFAGSYWNRAAEIDAALQSERGVFRVRTPNQVAVWVVTRYEEARAALNDPRLSKESSLLESLLTEQLGGGDDGPRGSRDRVAQLSGRYPHARLAVPAGQLDRQESAIMNGFQALPVLLGPTAQR